MSRRLAIVAGAGGTLGREFCQQLAALGDWHVVAVDVDGGRALETASLVEQNGSTAEARNVDVADAAAVEALRDELRERFPRLDLLVNSAGISLGACTGEGDLADWRRVMEVNYLGVLNFCHAMTSWLKASAALPGAPPAVINVASIFALVAPPSLGAYAASKAAVAALSEAMHIELRPHGVHVTVVAPGFFPSGLVGEGKYATPELAAQAAELVAASQITASDVVQAALAASRRGKLLVVVGRRATWLARLRRFAPGAVVRILSSRYARRK